MTRTKTSALDQLLLDLFTTALEGGIGYWSEASSYHWENEDGTDDVRGFYSDIIDLEGNADDGRSYRIDRTVLAKGYGLATSATWRGRLGWSTGKPPVVVGPDTDWDFDASDADMIVQLGLFSDVVYG